MKANNGSFAHRRAQRALQRQLEYQQQKAQKLRGHEPQLISGMTQASAEVRAKLQQARPLADDARVLEVGSGAHGLIFYFGSQNAIGVDPLAHHYSSLFPGWQRKATTIGAFGEALPFPDHSFDVVLCDNVVDHAESPTQIVSEIVRVLAPSGMLYFTVNVHHPIYSLASGIHGIWQRFGVPYEVGPFADHTVHLTVPGARELFARQPLRIVKETTDFEVARTRTQHTRARHAGDRLKRVFFKNAVYEVIAVRVTQAQMTIEDAYTDWSATYDSDRNLTRDLDQHVARQQLAKLQCKSILELGCGTGKNTPLLASIGEHVQGLDFSAGMIEKARAKVTAPNVTFEIADITKRWPSKDQSFDLIVCNLVLEHIDDLNFIFAEASRGLVEGGGFFICELHPFRQYLGTLARFQRADETKHIAAFTHHVTDFTNAALANGLMLKEMKEWWHEEDEGNAPRLISFLFANRVQPNR